MPKNLALALVGPLALAGASLAVAKGGPNRSVSAVSGTFTATTVSGKRDTRTCTTTDGKTLATTRATYTGSTASGSPDLTGTVAITTSSLINTSDDIGRVDARLRITTGSGKTDLHFTGVYDHGTLAGLATGHAATPHLQLVGNLSAAFSTDGGYTDGKIGGSSGGSAIALGPGRCAPSKPDKPAHENADAQGLISALSSTSITVAGLTCTVPTNLQAKVGTFTVGDKAHIKCTVSNGTATLTKIDKKH
jgi:hypothetical protein